MTQGRRTREFEAVDGLPHATQQILEVVEAHGRVVRPSDLGHAAAPRLAGAAVGPHAAEEEGALLGILPMLEYL